MTLKMKLQVMIVVFSAIYQAQMDQLKAFSAKTINLINSTKISNHIPASPPSPTPFTTSKYPIKPNPSSI